MIFTKMCTQANQTLRILLDEFSRGFPWLVRLLPEILGVSALSYVLQLTVFPIVSIFIWPEIMRSLKPFLTRSSICGNKIPQ